MKTLPKKWAVQRNLANYKEINKWADKADGINGRYNIWSGYIHSSPMSEPNGWKGRGGCYRASNEVEPNHEIITFEMFEEFVLGKPKKDTFPEKWLIRVRPEHAKFWNTNFKRGLPSYIDGYISSDDLYGKYTWGGYFYWYEEGQQLLNKGYVQISFKEFNEHYFGGKGLLGKEESELETIIKEKDKMSVENAILEEVTKIVTTDKQIEEKLLGKLEKLGIVPSEKVIILKEYDKTFKKSTVQHRKFETVLKCLDVRSNLALVGPAGK